MRQLVALRRHPLLEFRGTGKVEAVQEGTAVQACGELRFSFLQGAEEGVHVTFNVRAVQPQLGRARDRLAGAELPPRDVERLLEGSARALRVTVWPEEGRQAIAADALAARYRKQRQQCQRLPLCPDGVQRDAIPFEGSAAQCAKPKHGYISSAPWSPTHAT